MNKIKHYLFYILLSLVISIPAIKNIWLPGYYRMHDDLQVMRQLQMDKCFRDRQIPCRWSADMGYGYGFPIFNYYPPWPYYLGEVFVLAGFSLITATKIVFTLGFILGAIGMFLLGSSIWGNLAGLVSSVFFTYAPYHATDLYVRGAVNEFWAISWFPWILLAIKLVISSPKPVHIVLLSVTTALLMLSHNPMLMIFAPLAIIWAVYWILHERKPKSVIPLAICGLWAAGLAAFFTFPVIFESKFAHLETLVIGYFNFLAHFLDLNQMFVKMNWGFGQSVYGPADTMSFNIGHLHSIVWGLSTLIALLNLKKNRKPALLILLVSFLTLTYAFLMHWKATPIWIAIKPLEFLQFPWRLLSIVILTTSLMSAGLTNFAPHRIRKVVAGLLITLVVLSNYKYFRWGEWFPTIDDEAKLSGKSWQMQLTSGIFDYLPIWAPLPPPDPPAGNAEIISGIATSRTVAKTSNYQKFLVEVYSPEAVWQINTFYFPGWVYYINGKELPINPEKDLDPVVGRPQIPLRQGTSVIEAKFTRTLVRKISELATLSSWIVLAGYLLHYKVGRQTRPFVLKTVDKPNPQKR